MARPQQKERNPATHIDWRAPTALLLVALAAYANSFGLGLTQDSKVIVAQDPRVQAVSAQNVQLILEKNYWWPKAGDGLYRPVTTLSIWFNYAVLGNGPNPFGYHAVNFLLHAINVLLLYGLALAIFRRAGPAFFAAALWAVHPIDTEAVTSIVGRADLLATMAVLGGLLLYVKKRGVWVTATLFVIATLGVFSKENAAVLLGMMLLWDLSFGEAFATVRHRWRDYAAVGASLLVLGVVRHAVLGAMPLAQSVYVDNPLRGADFLTARWTAIKVIGLDLRLLLAPLGLSCDRSFAQISLSGAGDPWAWLALAVVIAVPAVAILRYRTDRLMFWSAGFCAIALLPTSNLLFAIGATMAERFLYLPAVAFAVAAVALLYRLKDEKLARTVLAVVLVVFGLRTLARNPDWKDDLALATADIPTTPRSFRLHDMLAKALFEQDAQHNIDQAIAEQEKSWEIIKGLPADKSSEFPPSFLGIYYTLKADSIPGDAAKRAWYTKAVDVLLRAREISQAQERLYDEEQRAGGRPLVGRAGFAQLYFNLANAYLNLGNVPGAIEALRYGRGLSPRALEVYDGLSIAYAASGDLPAAVATLEAKAQLDGYQAATMGAIRELYQKMPDGACAFTAAGQLNAGCPRVQADLCRASTELVQAFTDARQANQAAEYKKAGCP